jgi:hypothetical protein
MCKGVKGGVIGEPWVPLKGVIGFPTNYQIPQTTR